MPGVRDLEALLKRYGGQYVRTSSSGHKRWQLGKRMITIPNGHSLKGNRRTYDNVEAYIHRVAKEQKLRERK